MFPAAGFIFGPGAVMTRWGMSWSESVICMQSEVTHEFPLQVGLRTSKQNSFR